MVKVRFDDIPQRMDWGNYQIDVPWNYLEKHLTDWNSNIGLNLDPVYQRGHVWTEAQQKAYVEFALTGGQQGNMLLFNSSGWNGSICNLGTIELVDGKQRLTAVLRFLRNEMTVFDNVPGLGPFYRKDLEQLSATGPRFKVYVNGLKTQVEVMRWYLELNAGGTVHTQEELDKVRNMLAMEPNP